MKFKGQPNLYVKLSNKVVQRMTGLKGFTFNDKGEYETENELMIKVLKQSFEIIEEERFKCKKCDYETTNKGELLAHYKEHKKEV